MLQNESLDKVRVAIVEDEDLYRDLLKIAMSQHERFNVIGDFADGQSALEAIPDLAPDVVMLDIELTKGMNGIQLGLQLRKSLPDLGVVLLSNYSDIQFINSVPRDVVMGWSYLLKKSVGDVAALVRAIEGAISGFVVIDPQIASGMRPKEEGLVSRLTPRQRDIIGLISQGFNNATIASNLVLSEKSVENQINLIYQHLEVRRDEGSVHPRVKAVLTYLQDSY